MLVYLAFVFALTLTSFQVCHSQSFFDLQAKDVLEKETTMFEEYRGKVSLVTNIASACGYTDGHMKAYRQLHNLASKGGRFNILAFPCNQFDNQEPLEGKRLRQYIKEKYHSDYPVFEKTDVFGPAAHPVWKFINEVSNSPPAWNFWKYLIDHEGKFVRAWPPNTRVEDIYDEVKDAVDKAEKELGRVEQSPNETSGSATDKATNHGGEL